MILSCLIIAHLIGDFLLQPRKLVDWKIVSKWGTFAHVFIHAVVGFAILFPFLINGYYQLIYIILGVNFMHYWIDEAKINYALTHDNKVKPFIIDQLLHFIVLAIAYLTILNIEFTLPDTRFYEIYTAPKTITLMLVVVLFATVLNTMRFRKN
ncbi:MAG: DUF3307 domain-containing protein [Nitrospirota bacterium]